MKLSEIIKAINTKTFDETFVNEYNAEEYPSFIVNRLYSNFPDTLYAAYNMNKSSLLPKDLQYKYYYYTITRKSRYAPLIKEKSEQDTEFAHALAEEYGISKKSAIKHYKGINYARQRQVS